METEPHNQEPPAKPELQPPSTAYIESSMPGDIVPGESVRDNMRRTGETDPERAWLRLHGGHCSGGGGPC